MKLRKLRVAWSIFWGLACVLLIVLWARSYSSGDYWQVDNGKDFPSWTFGLNTCTGTLTLFAINIAADNRFTDHRDPLEDLMRRGGPIRDGALLWTIKTFPASRFVQIRTWFPTLLFAIFAAAPWLSSMRWRFTLRTLLIATTLVAVVLGLVVAGCGGTNKPIRPGEAMALNAAQTWLDSQGIDRGSVTLSADQSGDEWSVLIEREPATPGGHNLLRIKADGSITEVIPGA